MKKRINDKGVEKMEKIARTLIEFVTIFIYFLSHLSENKKIHGQEIE